MNVALFRSVPSVALMPSHGSVFVPIFCPHSLFCSRVLWLFLAFGLPYHLPNLIPSVYCKALASAFPEASSTSAADRDRHGFTKWPSFTRSSKILRLETILGIAAPKIETSFMTLQKTWTGISPQRETPHGKDKETTLYQNSA
jgi:hypothetical protein